MNYWLDKMRYKLELEVVTYEIMRSISRYQGKKAIMLTFGWIKILFPKVEMQLFSSIMW